MRTICGCELMKRKIEKRAWEENRMHSVYIEIHVLAITEIYKIFSTVYFLFESQLTSPPTVIVSQVVTKIKECLLFSGEVDTGHFVVLFPLQEKRAVRRF
jgi:hypothetical protein